MPTYNLEEAKAWRDREIHWNRKPELVEALKANTSDRLLVLAHNGFWEIYSAHIRYAPSNRQGQGVDGRHAKIAGEAGDRFAVLILKEWK